MLYCFCFCSCLEVSLDWTASIPLVCTSPSAFKSSGCCQGKDSLQLSRLPCCSLGRDAQLFKRPQRDSDRTCYLGIRQLLLKMTGLRRRKAEVKKILRISHPIHPDMQRLTTSPYNSHKSYKSPGSFRLFSFLDKDLTRISGKITKDFQKGENKARSFDVVLKR